MPERQLAKFKISTCYALANETMSHAIVTKTPGTPKNPRLGHAPFCHLTLTYPSPTLPPDRSQVVISLNEKLVFDQNTHPMTMLDHNFVESLIHEMPYPNRNRAKPSTAPGKLSSRLNKNISTHSHTTGDCHTESHSATLKQSSNPPAAM